MNKLALALVASLLSFPVLADDKSMEKYDDTRCGSEMTKCGDDQKCKDALVKDHGCKQM